MRIFAPIILASGGDPQSRAASGKLGHLLIPFARALATYLILAKARQLSTRQNGLALDRGDSETKPAPTPMKRMLELRVRRGCDFVEESKRKSINRRTHFGYSPLFRCHICWVTFSLGRVSLTGLFHVLSVTLRQKRHSPFPTGATHSRATFTESLPLVFPKYLSGESVNAHPLICHRPILGTVSQVVWAFIAFGTTTPSTNFSRPGQDRFFDPQA